MSEPINDRDQFVKDTQAGLPVNETGTTPAPRRRRSARYENQDAASAGYESAAQAPQQMPAYGAGPEVSGETRRVAVPPRQGYPARPGAQGYPRQGSQQWYGQSSGAEGQRPAMPPQGYNRQAPQGQQAQGYGRQVPQGQQPPQGYSRQPVRQNENYRQPPRGYEPPKEEEPEKKKHSKAWLVILLVLLLLIAACFGLYHLVPQDQEGVLGQARNAVAYVVEPVEALVVKPTETPTPEPTVVPTPEPTEVLPEETPEPDEPDDEADGGDEAGNRSGTALPSVAATETEKPLEESVSSFMASNLTGTAPQQVSILVRADNRVVDVRMVDADGEAMKLQKSFSVDGNFTNWLLLMQMDKGYEGDITLEVTDGNSWVDTGCGDYVDLADPIPAATDTPAPTATQVTYTATPSPEPTATPTPKPTKTPEPTKTPVPTNTPEPTATPTPAPTEAPKLDAAAAEEADPAKLSFDTTIYDNTKKLASYARSGKDKINMQGGADYSVMPMGVLTFRGDSFRRNAVSGTVEDASSMEVAWTADASSAAGAGKTTYYGIGWYGQPAIVKWSKEVREKTNMAEDKRTTTALKEVIVAGMDGRIYFLDLADGNPTRDAINVGYPMRGTPSIHPSGYPIMAVGQYARKMKSGTGKIGLRFYDMLNQAELPMIDGLDAKNKNRAYNDVGSFNSSALIDTNSDTLITVGTNGLLYLTKLGTKFDYKQGSLTLNTTSIVLKDKTKKEKGTQTAVDSSLAMYGDYAFYADTAGILRCVDVNTLSIIWAVKTGDTVQGAVALDFDENGDLCVYCANLLNLRAKGTAQVYCFDAATGARKWVYEAGTKKDTKTKITAGFVASPVIGENDLSDLCYFTVTGLTKDAATSYGSDTAVSALVALNKKTGSLVWSLPMSSYAFSSPIALYTTEGEGKIVQAESNGTVHLLDGLTGKEVSSLQLDGTVEASPAAYGDMMVIGTTGKDTTHIYGIRVK